MMGSSTAGGEMKMVFKDMDTCLCNMSCTKLTEK